jgi:hypothetical protein
MIIPTYFNIAPENQIGEVYGTEFTFTANFPYQYTKFVWNFGDRSELVYENQTVTHTYNYPGIYTVQLSSWKDSGELYVDEATVNVDYVYRDSVLFTQIPKTYGIPGRPSLVPFTVSLTSAKIDQPLALVLQSFNSQSVPRNSIPKKWNFITPNWRFTEADGTVLEGPLVLDKVPIYNSQNKVIAVRAEKSFYYIDDLSTGLDPDKDCPLMLVATLSTERFYYPPESLIYPYASYSNSEVARAVISWQINDVIPTNLKVTENFINPIFYNKWTNVPIPIMITLESNSKLLPNYSPDSVETYITTALSYPRTNELGLANEVVVTLSSSMFSLSEGIHYTVDEAPLYFKADDEYGNVSSGYIFTTITPLTSIPGEVLINVNTTVLNQAESIDAFAFPIGFPIQPNVYVSHPAKSTINKINVYNAPANCPAINKYRALGILVEGALAFVPSLTGTTGNALVSGSNVYAMSVNPYINRMYAADIELNTISSYFDGTQLLKTVNLEELFNKTNLGPSYISIDRYNNVWVSLFDDTAVIKFDADLNYLLSAVPTEPWHQILEPITVEKEYALNEDETYLDSEDIQEERALKEAHPPIVETDKDSNIWVCYPSDAYSKLFKFSSTGETLIQASELPLGSFPVSLSIGANNAVWVACKGTNNVLCFSTNGDLVSSIPGLIQPSYISHDRLGNICILHGYNIYSTYNVTTRQLSSWRVNTVGGEERKGTVELITEYTQYDLTKLYEEEDEIWGGLCTDVYNRVWIIDSKNNNVMSFKPYDIEHFQIKAIVPTGNYKEYYLSSDVYNPTIIEIPVDEIRSAQAGGDWTGNRWYQKYGSGSGSSPVQGFSNPFVVNDLDATPSLTKVNNSFNYAEHFKSLAFPEILQQNLSLFEFLSAAIGDENPNKESVSRVIYEKIANFVSNNGDVETAEIDALASMAEQMNVEYTEFGSDFPVAINNLISLFSVHKQRLRGAPNLETDISKNIGRYLSETESITADKFYLVKDKKLDSNFLVQANTYAGEQVYPIINFKSPGLRSPILDNYYIFEYNEGNVNEKVKYSNNLIDWENKFTTLSYNVSSAEEWYGDSGLIETMFNNLLTKQLFL